MNTETLASNLARLISVKSLSGFELEALKVFETITKSLYLNKERIIVSDNRYNLLYSIGMPKIIFTTHIDVVDGEDALFSPQLKNGHIVGRGACDAKGSLCSMLAAVETLLGLGKTGLGLLVVVGEEDDGIGAKIAAKGLKNRGVKYLINGEPTENCLAENSGGVFDVSCKFNGKAAHSGYPEFGEDANSKLLNTCYNIKGLSPEKIKEAGISSINMGVIKGGYNGSVVSPAAELRACIRTTANSNSKAIALIHSCIEAGSCEVLFDCPHVELFTLPDFNRTRVTYASDIPNFNDLDCKCLMYGPGSILDAHTSQEKVEICQLERAASDYVEMFIKLSALV